MDNWQNTIKQEESVFCWLRTLICDYGEVTDRDTSIFGETDTTTTLNGNQLEMVYNHKFTDVFAIDAGGHSEWIQIIYKGKEIYFEKPESLVESPLWPLKRGEALKRWEEKEMQKWRKKQKRRDRRERLLSWLS
jgi:hypothetical protein